MKRFVACKSCLALLLAVGVSQGFIAACGAAEFYVAANGNDRWSGKLAEPNAGRSDGPLASLSAARDAIRQARGAGRQATEPMTVLVRGGVYRLDSPLVFEPIDSGTAAAPVIFAAYRNERPVLSGGRPLVGFHQNGPLWETVVPEVQQGKWYFRQLFVGGKRRTRARSPNSGYYRVADLLPGPRDSQGKAVARDRFGFTPGDLKPWSNLSDVNLILMHSWETSIHPLKSIDVNSSIVEFAAPLKEWWSIGYWEPAQRYYVENARELLDEPGEWYLDRRTGVLSYWPMPGEKLGETEVVAPRLGQLVAWAGNADQGRFVEHVVLRGLAMHHSDWDLAPRGNSSTQAAVEVPAAIVADGARYCAIEGCEVAHVGTYAIWFRRGCKDCCIQRNRLFDLGAGGIRVGEPTMAQTDAAETSRTLVDNNHIFDGGHVYPAGIGVWLAQSSGNRIAHNDIHALSYSGMSIGWNWNDAPNRTHDNLIELNHVHDLGRGVLSDAGLIYCLGVSPGSVIRNNIFHDIWPYSNPALGWGIYLDATCGGYRVENNLVYNTLCGGLMFNNGGHEHVIENNIFAMSARQALWPYSEKRPSTFRRNIVYLTQGEFFVPYGERSLNERLAARQPLGLWDDNVYWHAGGGADPLLPPQLCRVAVAGAGSPFAACRPAVCQPSAARFPPRAGFARTQARLPAAGPARRGPLWRPGMGGRGEPCPMPGGPVAAAPGAAASFGDRRRLRADRSRQTSGPRPGERRRAGGFDRGQRRAGGRRKTQPESDRLQDPSAVVAAALFLRTAHHPRHGAREFRRLVRPRCRVLHGMARCEGIPGLHRAERALSGKRQRPRGRQTDRNGSEPAMGPRRDRGPGRKRLAANLQAHVDATQPAAGCF